MISIKSKRLTKITAGSLVRVVVYSQATAGDGPAARSAKLRTASEARARINRRLSWQQLEGLLAANFGSRDLWVTLTYDDEHYPPSRRAAVSRMQSYIRALRGARHLRSQALRYVKNIEDITESGLPARLHHHLVVNGTGSSDYAEIASLWRWGEIVEIQPLLEGGRSYGDIAHYMAKQRPPVGKNGWTPSRNLVRPKRESYLVDDALTLSAPAGARVLESEERHNSWGEYAYLKYLLPEDPAPTTPQGRIYLRS